MQAWGGGGGPWSQNGGGRTVANGTSRSGHRSPCPAELGWFLTPFGTHFYVFEAVELKSIGICTRYEGNLRNRRCMEGRKGKRAVD
jgi:hypothetical protein